MSENHVNFSSGKVQFIAKNMLDHCEKADAGLGEILHFIRIDPTFTEVQKQMIYINAVRMRDVLQNSIKMFREVQAIWERSCSESAKRSSP